MDGPRTDPDMVVKKKFIDLLGIKFQPFSYHLATLSLYYIGYQ
jgi:hypothetical protein